MWSKKGSEVVCGGTHLEEERAVHHQVELQAKVGGKAVEEVVGAAESCQRSADKEAQRRPL